MGGFREKLGLLKKKHPSRPVAPSFPLPLIGCDKVEGPLHSLDHHHDECSSKELIGDQKGKPQARRTPKFGMVVESDVHFRDRKWRCILLRLFVKLFHTFSVLDVK